MDVMGYPLVRVEWDDAVHPDPDWQLVGELKGRPMRMHSVGYLVVWEPSRIQLAQSVDPDPEPAEEGAPLVGGVMDIPARCVVRVARLERGRPMTHKTWQRSVELAKAAG